MNTTRYFVLFSTLICFANLVVRYYRSKQEKKEKQSSPLSIGKQSTFTNSKGEETIYIGACACNKE